jgi:hypothetical protein
MMKKFQRFLNLAAMFFFFLQAHGQFTIKYNFHPHDPDSCIVSFVDTVKNEVIRSFTLVEYSPYWNLAFPETGDKERRKSKTFKISSNDFVGDAFLNFVNYSNQSFYPAYCHKEPKAAHTYSTIIISNNKQFVIIPHYLSIYSDNCLYSYKAVLHIYNSKGELFRTIESHDLDITDVAITDDGNHLAHAFGVHLDNEGVDWTNTGYRIIDIENDMILHTQLVEFTNSYYDLSIGSFGNLISAFYSDQSDFKKYVTHTFCFENNNKYTYAFHKDIINKLITISDSGFIFGQMDRNDLNKTMVRFNEVFIIDKIE